MRCLFAPSRDLSSSSSVHRDRAAFVWAFFFFCFVCLRYRWCFLLFPHSSPFFVRAIWIFLPAYRRRLPIGRTRPSRGIFHLLHWPVPSCLPGRVPYLAVVCRLLCFCFVSTGSHACSWLAVCGGQSAQAGQAFDTTPGDANLDVSPHATSKSTRITPYHPVSERGKASLSSYLDSFCLI